MDEDRLARIVDAALQQNGLVLVLTGAGVSAASGIPTFRGPEGYWTVGSAAYRPQELATRATFARDPETVWAWYLHRLGVCRAAAPNAAHHALVDLERALGDRFLLVTQNVDGLHLRAGSSPARTFQVHGLLERSRCAVPCSDALHPMPADLPPKARGHALTEAERRLLRCPGCGGWLRPHVLWFDESYDEAHFRFDSALAAAGRTALLVTAGTSGATTLPALVVEMAVAAGAALVDANPDPNPFGDLAEAMGRRGLRLASPAAVALPALVGAVQRADAPEAEGGPDPGPGPG